jgi:hypothetical protein
VWVPWCFLPEFGVLQVLVAPRGDFHTEFEALLDLNAIQQLTVLDVPALDLCHEFLIGFGPLCGVVGGYGCIVIGEDVLQTAMDQIAQIGQELVIILIDEIFP